MSAAEKGDNPLHLSWHDSAWLPILNRGNILKYFSERSNPFYDSSCNNELIKMQGLSFDHLVNMVGIEYTLLHCQDPILYIVRKQMRHSPTQVSSLADYYVIAGTVYQAPDVKSIINSRLTSSLHHIENAFSEALSVSRYHPSKGYWWQFSDETADTKEKKTPKKPEETGSIFQCAKVDRLLENLTRQYPHKYYQSQSGEAPIPIKQNDVEGADTREMGDQQNQSLKSQSNTQQQIQSKPALLSMISGQSPGTLPGSDMHQTIDKRTKYSGL